MYKAKTVQVGFCGLSLNHSISGFECSNEMGQKLWYRGLNIVVKNICYHDFNYRLVFLIFLIWLVRFYWHTLYTDNYMPSFIFFSKKLFFYQRLFCLQKPHWLIVCKVFGTWPVPYSCCLSENMTHSYVALFIIWMNIVSFFFFFFFFFNVRQNTNFLYLTSFYTNHFNDFMIWSTWNWNVGICQHFLYFIRDNQLSIVAIFLKGKVQLLKANTLFTTTGKRI